MYVRLLGILVDIWVDGTVDGTLVDGFCRVNLIYGARDRGTLGDCAGVITIVDG